MQQMKKEGRLTVRITEWLPFDAPLDTLQQMRNTAGTTDPWLKSGPLKTHLDGSLGSRTAALLAPYSDAPKTSGILIENPVTLKPMAIERDKAGFQLAFTRLAIARTVSRSTRFKPSSMPMARETGAIASNMRKSSPRKILSASAN